MTGWSKDSEKKGFGSKDPKPAADAPAEAKAEGELKEEPKKKPLHDPSKVKDVKKPDGWGKQKGTRAWQEGKRADDPDKRQVLAPLKPGVGDGMVFHFLFGLKIHSPNDRRLFGEAREHINDDVEILRNAGYTCVIDEQSVHQDFTGAVYGDAEDVKGLKPAGVFWLAHGHDDGAIETCDGGVVQPDDIDSSKVPDSLKLVVFAACYTGSCSRTWRKALGGKPMVVGWGRPVTIDRAVEFLTEDAGHDTPDSSCSQCRVRPHQVSCSDPQALTRHGHIHSKIDQGRFMFEDTWEETVAAKTAPVKERGVGCLLQIHPLEVSGQLVELSRDATVIGRDSSACFCIPDASVSRRHAVIERREHTYTVTDLGSTNGTSVNERNIRSAELSPGDRIQFGSYIFKFLSTNHIELQYHEAVYSMMTRDGLTGTLNKRSFLDIIQREFRRSLRRHTPLSLILFDIDHFKSVNDTHGHLAGDEVLQEIGRRIETVISDHDVFARYGGEEFAILLADVPSREAVNTAEACRAAVAESPFPTSAGPLPVSISAGVADVSGLASAESPTDLIKAADIHLYAAKNGGRNRVCS